MTVNEALIHEAVLRASPETLDAVLDAVEAYRTCVATAQKLVRCASMETQRQQVLECAAFCEEKLAASIRTGSIESVHYPPPGMQYGRFVLSMEW